MLSKKIDFKDLNWLMKIVFIYGLVSLFWNLLVFVSAFIIVFWGGGF